jgi:hypothetical protein
MLTKNFTQHLAKDVPNFKRELDFKPASPQDWKAERFVRTVMIMPLERRTYFINNNILCFSNISSGLLPLA